MPQAIRNYGRWQAIIVGVEWVRRCEEEQRAVSHEEHMPEFMLSEVGKMHLHVLWTLYVDVRRRSWMQSKIGSLPPQYKQNMRDIVFP